MFSRAKRGEAAKKYMPSIISPDFRAVGDITADGDIQLLGRIEGNVRCRTLTIGDTGEVQGEISAERVRVLGKVVGPIKARAVELTRTGHVTGDIRHETLTIDTGAYLDGHCKRMDAAELRPDEHLTLVHDATSR